ncbi:hypothetical protein [Pectobacterium sp. B1J-3]|uniref:hypothetical protein n=1 Tax=Pectobacterium sp. B1J-3 TaxID=3385371 RepID=UPI0039063027
MKDPWNPQEKALRQWAFDTESPWPEQDFDLAVADRLFADIILELAADNHCPKQSFFLSCAYLMVGDAVRTNFEICPKVDIQHFLARAEQSGHQYLIMLAERGTFLIEHPDTFDYNQWCNGGLADADVCQR